MGDSLNLNEPYIYRVVTSQDSKGCYVKGKLALAIRQGGDTTIYCESCEGKLLSALLSSYIANKSRRVDYGFQGPLIKTGILTKWEEEQAKEANEVAAIESRLRLVPVEGCDDNRCAMYKLPHSAPCKLVRKPEVTAIVPVGH